MAKKNEIRLGVNIDHAATLRQVRGNTTAYPDLLNIVNLAVKGGAEQITIHLREDRRHIQESDLSLLSKQCPVPLNLEMAATKQMLKLAKKYKPSWACFVPESREELTTEGGLNVKKGQKNIGDIVDKLQSIGVEISMFIEPSAEQVKASVAVGADAVEFHTGKWVGLKGPAKEKEWKRLCDAAELAHGLGLGVHAGHGLDFETTMQITKLPYLEEVNIGHSIICYSLEYGITETSRLFKKILQGQKI
jgi:pyridoxine 5-phosphate synthase